MSSDLERIGEYGKRMSSRVTLSDSRCGTFTQSAMADDLEPDEDASKDEFMFNDACKYFREWTLGHPGLKGSRASCDTN